MLRRLTSIVTALTLITGFFVFTSPAPAQAQTTPGCWEPLATGSFDGSDPFVYENETLGTFGPEDALLLEIHSTTPLEGLAFIWAAVTPPAPAIAGDFFIYDSPIGFTDFSHVFYLNQTSGLFGSPFGPLTTQSNVGVLVLISGQTQPPSGTWGIWRSCGAASTGLPAYVDGRLCIWDDYAIYTDSDSIDVYGIAGSAGYLVASIDQADLDANPGTPGTNTLISQQDQIFFYRLGDTDTFEVHVGPHVRGMDKFARFTGLPAGDVFCGVVR